MKKVKGAGGSKGGIKQFFIGLAMMGVGFYMLLSKIVMTSNFGMGHSLYRHNAVMGTNMNLSLTTGMILIPMIIGIGWIFYNSKSIWGWALAIISLAAMIFGVISSLKISMQPMTAMDFIIVAVLAFGGVGVFLKSLRDIDKNYAL